LVDINGVNKANILGFKESPLAKTSILRALKRKKQMKLPFVDSRGCDLE